METHLERGNSCGYRGLWPQAASCSCVASEPQFPHLCDGDHIVYFTGGENDYCGSCHRLLTACLSASSELPSWAPRAVTQDVPMIPACLGFSSPGPGGPGSSWQRAPITCTCLISEAMAGWSTGEQACLRLAVVF